MGEVPIGTTKCKKIKEREKERETYSCGFLIFLILFPLPPLVQFFPVYAVFLCRHTADCEAYSFRTDSYGIFNVRTHSGQCVPAVHTKRKSGTNMSAEELTRRDRGSNPRVFGLDALTAVRATSPVKPRK